MGLVIEGRSDVVEARHRIGFCPQANSSCEVRIVSSLDNRLAVEEAAEVVTGYFDAQLLTFATPHELAAADGLLAFVTVVNQYRRGDALGPADQRDLGSIRYERGAVWVPIGRRLEPRAVFHVSTVNLDAASALTRRGARAQWGGVLNALRHPIQIVVRSTPATTMPVLERIKRHPSRQAQDLAASLGAHLHGAQLVERERYVVVPADETPSN
jgi:hypothetical protein